MHGILATASLLLVWGILIPALLWALRKATRRTPAMPADLIPLCKQALAIVRFAGQCADCAQTHHERATLFSALHALPDYPATLAKPPSATSEAGKRARIAVLDMQAQMAQTLRALQTHSHAPLDDSDRNRLLADAKRQWAKLKQLRTLTTAHP